MISSTLDSTFSIASPTFSSTASFACSTVSSAASTTSLISGSALWILFFMLSALVETEAFIFLTDSPRCLFRSFPSLFSCFGSWSVCSSPLSWDSCSASSEFSPFVSDSFSAVSVSFGLLSSEFISASNSSRRVLSFSLIFLMVKAVAAAAVKAATVPIAPIITFLLYPNF